VSARLEIEARLVSDDPLTADEVHAAGLVAACRWGVPWTSGVLFVGVEDFATAGEMLASRYVADARLSGSTEHRWWLSFQIDPEVLSAYDGPVGRSGS